MYEEVAPHALDFAKPLTEILSPADREAFDRAYTNSSTDAIGENSPPRSVSSPGRNDDVLA